MGDPSAAYYQANMERLQAAGIDPRGNDDTVLGVAFVYCHAHCRPHSTGWCTVRVASKTPLTSTTETEAYAEVRELGFYIDGEPWPCVGCGAETVTAGRQYSYPGHAVVGQACPSDPNGHRLSSPTLVRAGKRA